MTTTRAAVQTAARELELRDLDVPDEIGTGEALVRVEGCGICGADYERYIGEMDDSGLFEYPVVLGHEPVGVIEAIGADASDRWDVAVGDRVAIEPFAPCGVCEFCTRGEYTICDQRFIYGTTSLSVGAGIWGGFAERMLLRPGTVVHQLSHDVSIEDATFFNPLGAGFEWVCRAGSAEVGESVLVLGPGQRGLSAVIAAAEAGCGPIVATGLTRDADRLAIAEEFGATHTVDVGTESLAGRVDAITDGRGVDVVVDTTPGATQSVVDAIDVVRPGGTVVLAGTKGMREVDGFVSDEVVLDNISIEGTLGTRAWSFERAIDVIEAGDYDLDQLHSHTLGLDEIERAIQLQGGDADEDAFHITVTPTHD
ncbi:zinc-dependent alcohol dehydrogenase [Halorarius litoreus]|uniref:zinc-dependent alcohol dehydrogenase n=1 Tax=Halorarius litoreus TaxID=2962676 RepID=UPI0020CF5486|nr:alcohol dehydrogenase catalytic domain-containing protein [Halorarius litoreus]